MQPYLVVLAKVFMLLFARSSALEQQHQRLRLWFPLGDWLIAVKSRDNGGVFDFITYGFYYRKPTKLHLISFVHFPVTLACKKLYISNQIYVTLIVFYCYFLFIKIFLNVVRLLFMCQLLMVKLNGTSSGCKILKARFQPRESPPEIPPSQKQLTSIYIYSGNSQVCFIISHTCYILHCKRRLSQ